MPTRPRRRHPLNATIRTPDAKVGRTPRATKPTLEKRGPGARRTRCRRGNAPDAEAKDDGRRSVVEGRSTLAAVARSAVLRAAVLAERQEGFLSHPAPHVASWPIKCLWFGPRRLHAPTPPATSVDPSAPPRIPQSSPRAKQRPPLSPTLPAPAQVLSGSPPFAAPSPRGNANRALSIAVSTGASQALSGGSNPPARTFSSTFFFRDGVRLLDRPAVGARSSVCPHRSWREAGRSSRSPAVSVLIPGALGIAQSRLRCWSCPARPRGWICECFARVCLCCFFLLFPCSKSLVPSRACALDS